MLSKAKRYLAQAHLCRREASPATHRLLRTLYGCRGEERMVLRTSPLVLYRFEGERLSYSWLPGTFRGFMSLFSP